jgi:subtilisin family serine protease
MVDEEDAGLYSPARVEDAITVGASAIDDSIWRYSRTGSCLDIFAPGNDITSAWIKGKDVCPPHCYRLRSHGRLT